VTLPEFRLLHAAIVLAEELNFSRAAARLYIGQSTLTKQIQELEDMTGPQLFLRNRQNVQLTEAGRHFVEEARNAVLHAERAVIDAVSASHGAEEILHIGKSVYADPWLVTMLQSIHLSLFPELKIKLWSHFSHELAHMVATGQLDIALVTAVPDITALSFLTVAEAPVYVAMSTALPIAGLRELRIEDLRAYEWIVLAAHVNPYLMEMVREAVSTKRIQSLDLHYIVTAEEATKLVLMQKGIAFLTREAAWRISSDEITIRPLAEDNLKLITRLATRSDNTSQLVSEFVRAAGRKLCRVAALQQSRFR
jgi:DNA-binding transcriptional LysR family regulator